jgi:hypothetical protein
MRNKVASLAVKVSAQLLFSVARGLDVLRNSWTASRWPDPSVWLGNKLRSGYGLTERDGYNRRSRISSIRDHLFLIVPRLIRTLLNIVAPRWAKRLYIPSLLFFILLVWCAFNARKLSEQVVMTVVSRDCGWQEFKAVVRYQAFSSMEITLVARMRFETHGLFLTGI